MKECVKCKITKDLSCFPKDNKLSSGYRSKCKTCLNEEQNIRRKNNIDHIKPCFSFDLSIPSQQEECFHYSNQRPLWKTDNLKRPKNI